MRIPHSVTIVSRMEIRVLPTVVPVKYVPRTCMMRIVTESSAKQAPDQHPSAPPEWRPGRAQGKMASLVWQIGQARRTAQVEVDGPSHERKISAVSMPPTISMRSVITVIVGVAPAGEGQKNPPQSQ